MYICICKGITKSQLEEKARIYSNPKDILNSLGVGKDCGTCFENAINSLNTAPKRSAKSPAKPKSK